MLIDPNMERLLSISEAAKSLPNRPHVDTLWRWVYKGCKGVKLETISIGGRRFTSAEALQRFVERSTAAADRQPAVPTRTARQRQRAVEAAERELAAAGI